MKVVAEGVEDAACLQLLTEMGCDTVQGYFISRPVTAAAMTELLGERERHAA
jgi:EAL domain-containing protein (putative c-di-GMP-specific phosphodiesterase class I)